MALHVQAKPGQNPKCTYESIQINQRKAERKIEINEKDQWELSSRQ